MGFDEAGRLLAVFWWADLPGTIDMIGLPLPAVNDFFPGMLSHKFSLYFEQQPL
ncbi:MAG: hypothetical protein Q8O58_07500 [Gallionella sp.]|nr:hypothetical protein [Gallionella sp.]